MNTYTNAEICTLLAHSFGAFSQKVSDASEVDFEASPNGKWSAGQHLDHLIRSVKPLNQAFPLPKFLLGMLFGKTNRPSKSYEDLVQKYQDKLGAGGAATGRFVPSPISFSQKNKLLQEYENQGKKLERNLKKWSEADLDTYIAPHPLLGKITIRELLYFTIYHTEHHLRILNERD